MESWLVTEPLVLCFPSVLLTVAVTILYPRNNIPGVVAKVLAASIPVAIFMRDYRGDEYSSTLAITLIALVVEYAVFAAAPKGALRRIFRRAITALRTGS